MDGSTVGDWSLPGEALEGQITQDTYFPNQSYLGIGGSRLNGCVLFAGIAEIA